MQMEKIRDLYGLGSAYLSHQSRNRQPADIVSIISYKEYTIREIASSLTMQLKRYATTGRATESRTKIGSLRHLINPPYQNQGTISHPPRVNRLRSAYKTGLRASPAPVLLRAFTPKDPPHCNMEVITISDITNQILCRAEPFTF